MKKKRSPGQTHISVSLSEGLLAECDARAADLGMSRSKYIAALIQNDLVAKGKLVIQPRPGAQGTHYTINPAEGVFVEEREKKKKAR